MHASPDAPAHADPPAADGATYRGQCRRGEQPELAHGDLLRLATLILPASRTRRCPFQDSSRIDRHARQRRAGRRRCTMTFGSPTACNPPRRLTFRLLRELSRTGEPPENLKSPREAARTDIFCSLRKYRRPRYVERRRWYNTVRAGFRRFLAFQREDFLPRA